MHRILQQPDGRYAVWSTIVDDFILEDARERDLINWYTGRATTAEAEHITDRIDEIEEHGEVREYRGISTYEEAIEWQEELDRSR